MMKIKKWMIDNDLADDAVDAALFFSVKGVTLGTLFGLFEKYIFDDYPILFSVFFLVIAATIVEIVLVYEKRNRGIDWKLKVKVALNKLLLKFVLYVSLIFVSSIASKYFVNGIQYGDYSWVPRATYGGIVGRELWASYYKMGKDNPKGKNFFQGILDRVLPNNKNNIDE